ncbi:MAG: HAMP domain-containing histidine kinase [Azoarcus sp.]|jgi:two-component system sensor histidine kinase PilS (NtrC family)|nr:HAMP domain-containing histidine kinase [Azoarcus sp.]
MNNVLLNVAPTETDDPVRRRALRYLNLFRLTVAGIFLVVGTRLGLGSEAPKLFWGAAFAYAVGIFALGFPDAEYRIGFRRLMALQGFIDVVVLSIMTWTSGGYHSGIPVLMMIVLAGTGLVAEERTVMFMATLATIATLAETSWRSVARGGLNAGDFFQMALACISFFGIAIVARLLAQRAQANATLAATRGAKLARQEAINAHIIRDMRDGVIVMSAGGIVRQANSSACALLEHERIDGYPLAEVDPALAEYCRSGANELGQLMKLGQTKRLVRCRVACEAGGSDGDMLIYLTDLEDIQRHIQQIKLVSLGRLTASMAHEIRNPLSAVAQAAELLCGEKRSNMQLRLVRIINDNTRRIERMIRDVLALGRRERAQPEALPLAEFVTELLEERGLRGENERTIFQADIDPGLTLGIDRAHLYQILGNLVDNARRYCSGQPGSVRVEGRDAGNGQVWVHVLDDGPGIDENARTHLFEPFFTSHAKGTGLGLYIARELAEANGFSLGLRDNLPGHSGAHFILSGRSQP